jgi:hypothetical protein
MKPRNLVPELEQAIEAHADAFLGCNPDAAERFVAERGLETHRAAMSSAAEKRPLQSLEILACAKIGRQYIAKVRWSGARGTFISQNRWSEEGDRGWKIVEVEDLTAKRSAWSDIPPPATARRSGDGHA